MSKMWFYNFLQIPMKTTSAVDLVTPLTGYIEPESNTDLYETLRKIINLNQLRVETVAAYYNCTENGIGFIEKYYNQLITIKKEINFSLLTVRFEWTNAFDKSSSYTGGITFEQVCTIFNCGSVLSLNACHATDLETAAELFRLSADSFAKAGNFVKNSTEKDFTPDLSPETLSCLVALMLAQAQECIYIKASKDNMKPRALAELAARVSDMYTNAHEAMSKDAVREIWENKWVSIVNAKSFAHQALKHYHKGALEKERNRIGSQILELQKAVEIIVFYQSHSSSPALKTSMTKIQETLEEARKIKMKYEEVPGCESSEANEPSNKMGSATLVDCKKDVLKQSSIESSDSIATRICSNDNQSYDGSCEESKRYQKYEEMPACERSEANKLSLKMGDFPLPCQSSATLDDCKKKNLKQSSIESSGLNATRIYCNEAIKQPLENDEPSVLYEGSAKLEYCEKRRRFQHYDEVPDCENSKATELSLNNDHPSESLLSEFICKEIPGSVNSKTNRNQSSLPYQSCAKLDDYKRCITKQLYIESDDSKVAEPLLKYDQASLSCQTPAMLNDYKECIITKLSTEFERIEKLTELLEELLLLLRLPESLSMNSAEAIEIFQESYEELRNFIYIQFPSIWAKIKTSYIDRTQTTDAVPKDIFERTYEISGSELKSFWEQVLENYTLLSSSYKNLDERATVFAKLKNADYSPDFRADSDGAVRAVQELVGLMSQVQSIKNTRKIISEDMKPTDCCIPPSFITSVNEKQRSDMERTPVEAINLVFEDLRERIDESANEQREVAAGILKWHGIHLCSLLHVSNETKLLLQEVTKKFADAFSLKSVILEIAFMTGAITSFTDSQENDKSKSCKELLKKEATKGDNIHSEVSTLYQTIKVCSKPIEELLDKIMNILVESAELGSDHGDLHLKMYSTFKQRKLIWGPFLLNMEVVYTVFESITNNLKKISVQARSGENFKRDTVEKLDASVVCPDTFNDLKEVFDYISTNISQYFISLLRNGLSLLSDQEAFLIEVEKHQESTSDSKPSNTSKMGSLELIDDYEKYCLSLNTGYSNAVKLCTYMRSSLVSYEQDICETVTALQNKIVDQSLILPSIERAVHVHEPYARTEVSYNSPMTSTPLLSRVEGAFPIEPPPPYEECQHRSYNTSTIQLNQSNSSCPLSIFREALERCHQHCGNHNINQQ